MASRSASSFSGGTSLNGPTRASHHFAKTLSNDMGGRIRGGEGNVNETEVRRQRGTKARSEGEGKRHEAGCPLRAYVASCLCAFLLLFHFVFGVDYVFVFLPAAGGCAGWGAFAGRGTAGAGSAAALADIFVDFFAQLVGGLIEILDALFDAL